MSSVYRARRESDGRVVALKVLGLSELDMEFHPVERFRREAVLLERLDHPALPAFYGHGVTADDCGWIALELVEGHPLTAFSEWPLGDLLPIFMQIAEGLQAVAAEGIVHRDVSPDNILVEERNGKFQARLIDFGVAKDLTEGASGLTQHGAFLGKLQYASPEQILGLPEGQTIDFRSDIYSFGLTAYEIVMGKRAIDADKLKEIVDAHMRGGFPIEIPVERGGPALRFIELLRRMMSPKRDARPGTWEEVMAELWLCRAETTPAQRIALRSRAAESRPPVEEAPMTEPLLKTVSRPAELSQSELAKELFIGRAVLTLGIVALLLSLAAAYFLVRGKGSPAIQDHSTPPSPTAPAPGSM